MAIKRKKGKTKFMWLPVTASTVLLVDSLVAWSSGKLIAAISTTEGYDIAGVIRHAIASTDDDYADERLVEVEVPVEMNVVWECDVTATLVVADRGLFQDLTNSTTINRGGSTLDIAQCVKFISTTKGWFLLNFGITARRKAAS